MPQMGDKPSAEAIRQFNADLNRWRQQLQAQLPVPQVQQTATTATVDMAPINAAIAAMNTRIDNFIALINQKLASFNPVVDTSQFTTESDVKDIIKNSRYQHFQGVAASVWTINHNLGWKPSVTVVDPSLNVIIGDVEYINENSLTVSFVGSLSGYAYLN